MKNKLVFFVDDDKMILNLLEYTFKSRQGIDVKTFFSGEECLKNMKLKPDLVVMDHLFPTDTGQLSGLEVIRKIREVDKDVSIIVLSSQQYTTPTVNDLAKVIHLQTFHGAEGGLRQNVPINLPENA